MNGRLFQSCSRERQSHLESLHDFVSQATQELIWLNEKEEEEVAFDWSDRNINISKKRDYHAVSLCFLRDFFLRLLLAGFGFIVAAILKEIAWMYNLRICSTGYEMSERWLSNWLYGNGRMPVIIILMS